MNSLKYRLTSKAKELNNRFLSKDAFKYQRASLSKFLLNFKDLILTKDILNKAVKCKDIPSLSALDCKKIESNTLSSLSELLSSGGIYRFLNILEFIYPARIIRDYGLSLRNRNLRIFDAISLLIGISVLNADREDGRQL